MNDSLSAFVFFNKFHDSFPALRYNNIMWNEPKEDKVIPDPIDDRKFQLLDVQKTKISVDRI